MKSAYFHCIGGASGDMILGAIIDAGVSVEDLRGELSRLKVNGYSITTQRAQRGGVSGTWVKVELDESGQRTRHWREFVSMAEDSDLPENVVQRASAVFQRLAEAEAMVHGTSVDDIHLHELGTLDTLVDVVGSIVGLEMLGVERLYCSPFPSGSGIIRSEHGVLPVPSPATAALFAMATAPVIPPPGNAPETGEMVTPTGAAILTTLAAFRQPSINVQRVGYGLGTRESRHYPNALGLWLGEETGATYNSNLKIIETNIDDMSGEMLGYVQERLFELGARDVWFTPIQMKKNRPATMMSAIIAADLESQAVSLVIRETSTLGVRVRTLDRYEAERETLRVKTSLGDVQVKVKRLEGRNAAVHPEYEECRKIALERGIPLQAVYRTVQREAEEQLLDA
ncbi:MAG: nickel pincer cofactor biosynthesis protein LarC [Chloroflexi bacterium]|nr:nickel pincer cofactor biosynthesis protein LarC [Chloroflexota bacterium]